MHRLFINQALTVMPGCHTRLRLWMWVIPMETTAIFHH